MSGLQRHSGDLPQGGMELPYIYKFNGPSNLVQKAQKLLEDKGNTVGEFTDLQTKHVASYG